MVSIMDELLRRLACMLDRVNQLCKLYKSLAYFIDLKRPFFRYDKKNQGTRKEF